MRSHYSQKCVGYYCCIIFVQIHSVFKNPRFCIIHFGQHFLKSAFLCVFVRIIVNNFTKLDIFLSVCVQRRSSGNRALPSIHYLWPIQNPIHGARYQEFNEEVVPFEAVPTCGQTISFSLKLMSNYLYIAYIHGKYGGGGNAVFN